MTQKHNKTISNAYNNSKACKESHVCLEAQLAIQTLPSPKCKLNRKQTVFV